MTDMSRRSWQTVVLVPATLTTGLTAGTFGDWAHTTMPGLHEADDRTFVGTFQALDDAILNPVFMVAFMGSLVLSALAAILYLRDADHSVRPWAAVAFGLNIAAFVITMAVHEPLNEVIRDAGDPAGIANPTAVRGVTWHIVRTIATTAAFGCLTWALVLHGRAGTGVPERVGTPGGRQESSAWSSRS
jgi:uncharacterized membrane protein